MSNDLVKQIIKEGLAECKVPTDLLKKKKKRLRKSIKKQLDALCKSGESTQDFHTRIVNQLKIKMKNCDICRKSRLNPAKSINSEISKELRKWLKVNVVYGNDSISAFDAFTRFKNDNTHINISSQIFLSLLGQDIQQTYVKATKRKRDKITFYFGLKWIKERRDEIIYENKADKNKLNENTIEKKRTYEKILNENTIKAKRIKENKSSENKPTENTPSENKLEEKKINEKKINNNRINEKQRKKNQPKENKVDENRMNNINQVMISGFHEHTTPSQIQAIMLAFSENEGNCRLGGTAILEKQLGITLIFDNPAVARLVISKYNQTEFLGFRIRVSTSHIKARYGEDKPVNYEIPSPPSPYRKVVNGRNMMRRRVVTLKENKGGKELTKSSNIYTTSTNKNTTECLKELRAEANVRFKINKQKSPLLSRVIQYNQHDSSTIPHQKGLLSTPPCGKGILNYPVASSFRNSNCIPVKPILDSKEKQEHNENISYKVRLPSEHAFSKDEKVSDQAGKFTVNDKLINEKPKRRFVEHPSLQNVKTVLPSVDKKLLEDNHAVKTTVPNQLNTSKSTANTIESPAKTIESPAKTIAFTIKTIEPTLKTNVPPSEPQLKPKRKFTECTTLLSTTGHSKNKLVDKSIENNNVDVSSPKRKRYDKFANEMNKSIYHGFRGWRKRSITLMTSVQSKDKNVGMDSESTIPVIPIQSQGGTPKKFSPVLISNEKQISSGNSLSETLTKATSIENNDQNLMFPIQTSERKQTKRKNRNYSPISDISQSDLGDVFDDEENVTSSNKTGKSRKAIVNKDYGSSSSSSSKSSSDDASSTSTCSTSSSEEDDSTSSSTEGCDKTCSSPEQNYATNDTVVVTEEEIKRDNRKQKRNENLLEKNSHNNKEYIEDEQHQTKITKENQCSSSNMTKVIDATSVCSACHKKFKNLLCEDEVNNLVETNNNNEHTINKNVTKNHQNTAEKSTQYVFSTDKIKVEVESTDQNNLLEKCCGTCDILEEEKLEEFSKDCRVITSTLKILISKNPDLHNRLVTSCKSMLTELKERMLDHLHQDG